MQQERNPTTVSQLLTQNLQNRVIARDFYDPETASGSGASHVPSHPLIVPSPREMRSRDSGLALGARNTTGTAGKRFLKVYLLEKDHPQLSGNSRSLAPFSCGFGPGTTGNIMEHGRGVRQEPQSSAIPTPRFNHGVANLNPFSHTGGNLFSQWYDG